MEGMEMVTLNSLMIHHVGNAGKGDALTLSELPVVLNDALVQQMLVKWFTTNMELESHWQFTHASDLALNELYTYASQVFDQPDSLPQVSQHIAEHLYKCSTHVKIKAGELYVALLEDFPWEDQSVKALGLFKSERKDAYLKVFPHGKNFALTGEEGINIHKVEKAALIVNVAPGEGYRLLVVDALRKGEETRYFTEQFLQVQPVANSFHHTRDELTTLRQFVQKAYPQQFEVGKAEQIDLMQRSMDYFAEHDSFTIQSFTDEVLQHDEVKQSFQAYRQQQQHSGFEMPDEFDIHLSAVAKQKRQFKSVIKLDKNFHLYVHGGHHLIEKGVDPQSGKQYYKLYFDEES